MGKPNRKIYEAAISQVVGRGELRDLFGDLDLSKEKSVEVVYDRIGPWWVHIGDDFIKDIVAAKDMGMRSIWCRELIKVGGGEEKKKKMESTTTPPPIAPSTSGNDDRIVPPEFANRSQDTESDILKEMAAKKVVTMTIGSEDFLSDSIQRDFADATVEQFVDIVEVLQGWHQDAGATVSTLSEVDNTTRLDGGDDQDRGMQVGGDIGTKVMSQRPSNDSDSNKFCVYCGTKVPRVANFCSSCGERQPELN